MRITSGFIVLLAMITLFGFIASPGMLFAADAPPQTQASSTVTIDVRDADLRAALMELAGKARINLLISPKVRGTLTCRVTDMDPLELLVFIARANGLEFEDHGRIKVIMVYEPVPQSNMTFEIITLQNANAEKVAKMIESLRLDKNTHVVHDAHGNRLIVTHRN